MIKEKKKIFVVALLPKYAGWRGEGIAQTIENLIVNLPLETSVYIVVNWWHRKDLEEGVRSRSVEIISSGKAVEKKMYTQDALLEQSSSGLLTRIFNELQIFIKKIFNKIEYIEFLVNFHINSYKLRLQINEKDVLWLPIPTLPMPAFLGNKNNILMSYWDSFGFEYSEFHFEAKKNALNSIISKIKSSKKIVTQSAINALYLTDVLKVDRDKVYHLPVGSPDYSKYLNEFQLINKKNSIDLLRSWGDPVCWSINKKQAIESITKDLMAKTVFFRLVQNAQKLNKFIVLVSTQARPYKGLEVFLKLMQHIKNSEGGKKPIIIFTTELPPEIKKKFPELFEDIHEFSRLNQRRHALLNYISDLVVHPSFVEGGDGAYPSFEAQSLNVPSVINAGRHTNAWPLAEKYGCVSDFTDLNSTAKVIYKLLEDEEFARGNIDFIKNKRYEWVDVASKFDNLIRVI